jgi:NhaP-type Na+/H+ or K+/H+ antiporter
MELLSSILKNYGVWGLIVLALVYFILRSKVTLIYPRPPGKDKMEHTECGIRQIRNAELRD